MCCRRQKQKKKKSNKTNNTTLRNLRNVLDHLGCNYNLFHSFVGWQLNRHHIKHHLQKISIMLDWFFSFPWIAWILIVLLPISISICTHTRPISLSFCNFDCVYHWIIGIENYRQFIVRWYALSELDISNLKRKLEFQITRTNWKQQNRRKKIV